MQEAIETKLADALDLIHLEVINESYAQQRAAGLGVALSGDIGFRRIDGQRMVARHQLVYAAPRRELKGGVHALAVHTYTRRSGGSAHGEAPLSPPCRGGSKAESA